MVERALVNWVREHPDQDVYTDVETYARSEFYFHFAGLQRDHVHAGAPPPGAHFFTVHKVSTNVAGTPRCKEIARQFRPQSHWQAEQIILGPLRPAAKLASAIGLGRVLPADITRRVLAPIGEVTVYKVNSQMEAI